MTEKISNILFHPSTLIQYKKINLFKALLYLLVLGLITSIVPVIETFKFSGYTIADKSMFEEFYSIRLSNIKNAPNCALTDQKLTCETNEDYEILNYMNLLSVVIDVDGKMKPTEHKYYLRLTEKNIKLSDNQFNLMVIEYDELPTSWRSFDLKAIKEAPNPETAFFNLFISGVNELRNDFIVYEVFIKVITMCLFVFFQVLFYSFLFYIIIGRKTYRFFEVFKVATFAYTLPVLIGLFFSLLNMEILNSTVLAILTIIYIHIALTPNRLKYEGND